MSSTVVILTLYLCLSECTLAHDMYAYFATQGEYGYLLACFNTVDSKNYCLVQRMSPDCSSGVQTCNEFDCPLYFLSFTLSVISSNIYTSVSFVHQCSNTCILSDQLSSIVLERETCSTKKIAFIPIDPFVSMYFV